MGLRPSPIATEYLSGLSGIEIGGSAHNPFYLNTRNVDFVSGNETVFKQQELESCGEALKVDIVAVGDDLPLSDDSQDFVISSHVIEHFFDPIAALKEWFRVTKPGGYVFLIVPHQQRTFDRDRSLTTLQELIDRHEGRVSKPSMDPSTHYSVWRTKQFLELCKYLNFHVVEWQDVDDKVGNGFAVLLQKEGVLQNAELRPAKLLSRKVGRAKRRLMDFARSFKCTLLSKIRN